MFLSTCPAGIGIPPGEILDLYSYDEHVFRSIEAQETLKRREMMQLAQNPNIISFNPTDLTTDESEQHTLNLKASAVASTIGLKVRGPAVDGVLNISVETSAQVKSILHEISLKINKPASYLKVSFDGSSLKPEQIISNLDLEDGDLLELKLSQASAN